MNTHEQNNLSTSEEQYLTYEEILEEYRRRQMIEHLTGPVISLILHVIVITLFAFFLAGREVDQEAAEIEFDIQEMEIEPLDPEMLDDLEEPDPDIDTPVPTIEPPEIQAEAMEAEDMQDFAEDMADTDIDMDFARELDVRPSRSPLVLPGVMGTRGEEGRQQALREHAGRWGQHTERAVVRALEWLKENQNPDGSWPYSRPPEAAMTALAVLTFLAHNELPGESDRYGDTVRKGIENLVEQVLEEKYDPHGSGGAYANGIVAYALSEAYSMTRIPKIRPAMEEALRRIVEGQLPKGGFDYKYDLDRGRNDMSVTAWQAQALKAGFMAGAEVEGLMECMDNIVDFIKNEAFDRNRGFAYAVDDDGPSSWRRAAVQGGATLSLQLLGEGDSNEARWVVEMMDELREDDYLQWSEERSRLPYEVYYMTQAVFHAGTRYFRPWNEALAPVLVRNQEPDGSWRSPARGAGDDWEDARVMNTTLSAMTLMVYYRFLPTFQDPEDMEETVDIFEVDEDELTLEH